MTPDLVTTSEAAVLVGVTVKTVRAWAHAGLLVPVERGGLGAGSENTYRPADVLAVEQRMQPRRHGAARVVH